MGSQLLKKTVLLTFLASFAMSQSACLKTRAQLREESGHDEENHAPTQAAPVQDVQPQGQYVIDEIKGEFTRLEGRVEDLERLQKQGAANSTSANKDDFKKLEQRIIELEQPQANMIETIKKLQEAPATAANPSEMLEKGKTQAEGGNFEGAAESFTAALKSAKGKIAEEATFLRAEAYYALKDYKKAIVDYSKFPEKFNRSGYMAKALFQIGRSFEALGMKDDAKGFYQELVEKYPKSPEAKKAKSKVK